MTGPRETTGLASKRNLIFLLLIGSYAGLRWLFSDGTWPTAGTFGIPTWIGATGAALLVGCSVCIHMASKASRLVQAWLQITLVLGLSFLCVRVAEYSIAVSLGAVPGVGRMRHVYDRADLHWLSHVKNTIDDEVTALEQATQSREDSKRHLETVLTLKDGLIAWTQRVVGQSENDFDRRVALDLLAWQIEPAGFDPAERERLTRTEKSQHQEVIRELDAIRDELTVVTSQLSGIQDQLAIDDSAAAAGNKSDPRTRLILDARKATEKITEQTARRVQIEKRAAGLELLQTLCSNDASRNEGINKVFDLPLPIVIPNGNRWTCVFWLMTSAHAAYVAAVCCHTCATLCRGEVTASDRPSIKKVARRWHFVDIVSILLFSLLYLF